MPLGDTSNWTSPINREMKIYGDDTNVKRKVILQYTLFGVLFGFIFPIVSSLWLIYYRHMPLSLISFVQVQRENPLHWVIDTAKIFLGIFACFAGIRQA